MRTVLKYLLPFVVAAAFIRGGDASAASTAAGYLDDLAENTAIFFLDDSDSDSHLWIPRQVSPSGPARVQSGVRRTNTMQRNNLEVAKSGRIVNAGVKYFIQKISIITQSSLTEPAHLLLSLGKLII